MRIQKSQKQKSVKDQACNVSGFHTLRVKQYDLLSWKWQKILASFFRIVLVRNSWLQYNHPTIFQTYINRQKRDVPRICRFFLAWQNFLLEFRKYEKFCLSLFQDYFLDCRCPVLKQELPEKIFFIEAGNSGCAGFRPSVSKVFDFSCVKQINITSVSLWECLPPRPMVALQLSSAKSKWGIRDVRRKRRLLYAWQILWTSMESSEPRPYSPL